MRKSKKNLTRNKEGYDVMNIIEYDLPEGQTEH